MCIMLGAAAAGAAAGGMGGIGSVLGIAQMGLGIMGAMSQYQAQQQAYQEQVRFRQEQAVQAQKTLNQQVAQHQAAIASERGKAQGEMADTAIRARKAESTAQTGAAESGVVGLSVGHLTADIMGEKARFDNRIRYNSEMATFNTMNELKMAQRGAQSQVASIPIPQKPSFLPTAVNIGSAVVSGLGTSMKYANQNSSSYIDYRRPA